MLITFCNMWSVNKKKVLYDSCVRSIYRTSFSKFKVSSNRHTNLLKSKPVMSKFVMVIVYSICKYYNYYGVEIILF